MADSGTSILSFVFITLIVMVGLYISNVLYDHNIPQYVSRKVGHVIGGVGYILSVMWFPTPLFPLILSIGFTMLLLGARFIRPSTFRGVGGSSRQNALAEIWFPLSGTVALLVGWVWLNNPMMALVPILYMAFGDAATGLIRATVYKKEVKGNWGSVGMLITCLAVGLMFTPYWIAAVGAVVATLAEKFSKAGKWLDDNYSIIASSLTVMGILWTSLR